MADIFISHSTKDIEISNAICKAIEDYGYTCWISDRDILGGMDFAESIAIAIERCKIMVLVFSQNSNTSPEVKNEIVLAGQSLKVVIPLLTENIKVSPAFRYHLASRQWIDCTKGWEDSLIPLFTQLKQLIGDPPNPARKSEFYKGEAKPAPVTSQRMTMKPSEMESTPVSAEADAAEEALKRAREIDAQRFIEEEKAKKDASARAAAEERTAAIAKEKKRKEEEERKAEEEAQKLAREMAAARAREEEQKKRDAEQLAAQKAREAKAAAEAKAAKKLAEELVDAKQEALSKHSDTALKAEISKATNISQINSAIQKFEKNKLAQAQAALRKAQFNQQISKASIAIRKPPIMFAALGGLAALLLVGYFALNGNKPSEASTPTKTVETVSVDTNQVAANAVVQPISPVDGYLQSYIGNYVVFTSNCDTGTKFAVSRDDSVETRLTMTANGTLLYKFNFDSHDESGKDYFMESNSEGKETRVTFENSTVDGVTKLSVTGVPALRKCG